MTTNVTTRRIRIAAHDGGEFEGYLAVPASGSGPAWCCARRSSA